MTKRNISKSGFIVHPFETADGKYHVSYGSHNKTVKSFKTLKESKQYLAKNNITKVLYDSPSGAKDIFIKKQNKKKKRRKNRSSISDPFHDVLYGYEI